MLNYAGFGMTCGIFMANWCGFGIGIRALPIGIGKVGDIYFDAKICNFCKTFCTLFCKLVNT